MSAEVDAFLDSLGDEARGAFRALAARAYERGFREGMSTAGLSEDELRRRAEIAAPRDTEPPAPPSETTGAPIALPLPHDDPGGVEWGEEPDEGEERADEPPRPISARASIGTLLRRIEQTFQLERFDVDVVVCRRGDRDRRQLKSTVALSRYLRER